MGTLETIKRLYDLGTLLFCLGSNNINATAIPKKRCDIFGVPSVHVL